MEKTTIEEVLWHFVINSDYFGKIVICRKIYESFNNVECNQ
jgi:hypothetical protein